MDACTVWDLMKEIEDRTRNEFEYEEMLYRELIQNWKFSYRTGKSLIRMVNNSDVTKKEAEFLFKPEIYKDVDMMVKFVKAGLIDLVPESMFMDREFLRKAEISELPAHFIENYRLPYSFVVLEEIKTIGAHAFEGCAELQKVMIDDGLEKIGIDAFRESGIHDVRIPDTVKKIRSGAFRDCGHLTEVRLPKDIKRIESDVFNGCGWLRGMNLPKDIYAGDRAFKNCTELRFPNALKAESLGEESFYGCTELRKIVIGTPTVPKNAFLGCLNLTTAVFQEVPDELCEGSFLFCRSLSLITIAGFEYDIYGVKGLPELMRNASPVVKNVMSMKIKAGKDIHMVLDAVMQ